jgi:POT family proton-dependent oligopeptide transporter
VDATPTTPRKFAYGVIGMGLLSVTTKLAPEAFRAQMMALYSFSVGLGTSMSGVLARYYDPVREFAYFGIIGAVAIFAGLVVFAIEPWISRLMEGVH